MAGTVIGPSTTPIREFSFDGIPAKFEVYQSSQRDAVTEELKPRHRLPPDGD